MDFNSFPITVPILGIYKQQVEPEEEYYPPTSIGCFTLEVGKTSVQKIAQAISQRKFASWPWFRLALWSDQLGAFEDFSELLCLNFLAERWKKAGVVPYPHQLKTAKKVVQEMNGQAILADEVGLGKTIEAGIILKEYMLRQLVKRVLILVPASLCWQWYQELYEKFDITAGIQKSSWDWENCDVLIASIDTAKRKPHRDIITRIPYDLVIIDEAHKLKNSNTANWRLINELRKKYCLMLTATPVQNDLKELYNLITLLKPGTLGSYRQFKKDFVEDKRTPKNPKKLQEILSKVIIRNRRGQGTVEFTKRHVHPIKVKLSSLERELYERTTSFIRNLAGTSSYQNNFLSLMTLQREICSSFYAAALTLKKMHENNQGYFAEQAGQLLEQALSVRTNSKCDILEELLEGIDGKVVVFTEYKATQEYIRYRLERKGYSTVGFDGSLSRSRKEWIKHLFLTNAQIMVSTESGGEGLNLQFCNKIVNFDLPWNPMRLEQRIGRVHRLGQTQDVHIFNLITENSIEEHVMYLLHQKINMFRSILGELEAILLNLKLEKTFEGHIMDIFVHSDSDKAIKEALDKLGDQIMQERERAANPMIDILPVAGGENDE